MHKDFQRVQPALGNRVRPGRSDFRSRHPAFLAGLLQLPRIYQNQRAVCNLFYGSVRHTGSRGNVPQEPPFQTQMDKYHNYLAAPGGCDRSGMACHRETGMAPDSGREKCKKYLPAAFAAVLLLTELWGAAPYLDAVHRNNETARQTSQRYAAEMSETLAELYTGKKLYVLAENVPSEKILLHAPVFYHLDKIVVTTDREAVKSDSYYVLTDQREKYRNAEKRVVASYHWEDKEYWMLEVSKKQPSIQGAVSLPDEAFLLWKAA